MLLGRVVESRLLWHGDRVRTRLRVMVVGVCSGHGGCDWWAKTKVVSSESKLFDRVDDSWIESITE